MGTAGGVELEGRWSLVRGTPVYHRAREVSDAPVILHLHGFAISGSYMVPTASLLADEFTTYVPDLPGFGRSPRPDSMLTIPELADSAAGFLDAIGAERATVVGNSLGCAVLGAFAQRHPDRLERAVMVSPAGGKQSQPLARAIWQLVQDAPREPPSMATLAVPDYVSFGVVTTYKLFVAMTQFSAFQALIEVDKPLLAILGIRDPLLPPAARIKEIVRQMQVEHLTIAVLKDAAHAINYSHPREAADLIRGFMRGDELHSDLDPVDGRSAIAVISRRR